MYIPIDGFDTFVYDKTMLHRYLLMHITML